MVVNFESLIQHNCIVETRHALSLRQFRDDTTAFVGKYISSTENLAPKKLQYPNI